MVERNDHKAPAENIAEDEYSPDGPQRVIFFIKYLYSELKWRMFLWIGLVAMAAILDVLSVGMFLPILNSGDTGFNRVQSLADKQIAWGQKQDNTHSGGGSNLDTHNPEQVMR